MSERKHLCRVCDQEKPYSDFYLRSDGYPQRRTCKSCQQWCDKSGRPPKRIGHDPVKVAAKKVRNLARLNAWAAKNSERAKQAMRDGKRKWDKQNVAHVLSYNSARRARSKKATLPGNERWIEAIYETAQGLGLEVDHVVPLKGENVSGLHVPWNMQLLSRARNAAKNNSFAA